MKSIIYIRIVFSILLVLTFSGTSLCYASGSQDDGGATEIKRRLAIADSLHQAGRSDSALLVGHDAIELAYRSGNPLLKVAAQAAQGVYLRSLGRVEEALECYSKGLSIVTSGSFRENPTQDAIEEIATLYINLAVLNLDMQHKEEGAKNAIMAGDWIKRSEDPALKSTIYGVAGSVLTGAAQYEKASDFQTIAYRNALLARDTDAAFRAAAYSMLLADRMGKTADRIEWEQRCEEMLPEINAMMSRLIYFQAQCSVALKNNKPDTALQWFDKILSLDGIENLPFVKFDCYNNMHIAYASTGRYKDAYDVLLKSNEIRDSLWEKQKQESLRDLTVKYETKETELALAQSEARRSRILAWLLAAVALIALGTAFFISYAARQRRRRLRKEMEFAALKSDTERRLTEEYIGGLECERQRLASELHDGICNDLLGIQMNIRREGLNDKTEELISRCRESVRRISHEMMPPEFHYASLEEVIRYHVAKNNEAAGPSVSISFSSEADNERWADIPDAEALEIYRILQEALSNAIRHSGADRIYVTLTLNANTLILSVADNGRFHSSSKKGIGIESMRRRSKAIGASIHIDTQPSVGTIMTLTVNI